METNFNVRGGGMRLGLDVSDVGEDNSEEIFYTNKFSKGPKKNMAYHLKYTLNIEYPFYLFIRLTYCLYNFFFTTIVSIITSNFLSG